MHTKREEVSMLQEIETLGFGGWVGWVTAALTGGIMAFRHFRRADIISGANTEVTVNAIQRLYDLLDRERLEKAGLQTLLKEANERTDIANKELNTAIKEMGEIRAELAELRYEVRMLRGEAKHDQSD